MSLFLCSHFASLSEFIPSSTGQVSHGDCGWDALLMCANTYDPARFPLTGDGLAAIRDDAIAHGYADPNGAVNIPNLDRYLTDHGYPHRTVGYQQFDLAQLHTLIQGYLTGALKSPIILETSTAGAGLVEDESGVQFHFFALGGEDTAALDGDGATGGYLRGDGDAVKYNNWPGPKYPIATSWGEITRAGIIGYIILDGVPPVSTQGGPKPMGIPTGWKDDGVTLTAPNGKPVVLGFRDHVIQHAPQWAADNWPLEQERHLAQTEHHAQLGPGERQVFLRTILRFNSPAQGVMESDAGAEVLACEAELAAAQQAVVDAQAAAAQAQSALSSMQAQRDALSAKLASGQQAVAKVAADSQTLASDVAAATKAMS